MKVKKYRFVQKVGKFRVGQIVDDSDIRIRRLIQEGDALEPYKEEKKSDPPSNKMVKSDYENKEAK